MALEPEVMAEAAAEVPQVQAAALFSTSRLISLGLVLVSVGFAVVAQLTLKVAMNDIGRIGKNEVSDAMGTLLRVIKEPKLWLGLTLFGISAIFWLVVLSRVPLSVAYPFVGLSYIVIVAFSRIFLGEHVPLMRWLGVLVVALGIGIIGLSFKRATGT